MGGAVWRVERCRGLEDLDATDLGNPIRLWRSVEAFGEEGQAIVKTVGGEAQVDAESAPVLALLEVGFDAVGDPVAFAQRQEERAGRAAAEEGGGEARCIGARVSSGRSRIGQGNIGDGVVDIGFLPFEASLEVGRTTLRRAGAGAAKASEALDQGLKHCIRFRVSDRDGAGRGGPEVDLGGVPQGRFGDLEKALGGAGDGAGEGVGTPAGYVKEGADAALVGMLSELLQDDLTFVLDVGVGQTWCMEDPAKDPSSLWDPVRQNKGVKTEVVMAGGGVDVGASAGECPGKVFGITVGAAAEEDVFEKVG